MPSEVSTGNAALLALAHGAHLYGTVHLEVEAALVRLEVGADHLGGGAVVVGACQLHTGQGVHTVHLAVRERGPPELPGSTRPGRVVQDHEVLAGQEPDAPQMVGGGQPRLPGTDDHHVELARPGIVHGSTNP